MPRDRSNQNSGYILAGLAAGLACGIVVLVGWLAFRHPNEPEKAKEEGKPLFYSMEKMLQEEGPFMAKEAADAEKARLELKKIQDSWRKPVPPATPKGLDK